MILASELHPIFVLVMVQIIFDNHYNTFRKMFGPYNNFNYPCVFRHNQPCKLIKMKGDWTKSNIIFNEDQNWDDNTIITLDYERIDVV
jgi:hypothetical protein